MAAKRKFHPLRQQLAHEAARIMVDQQLDSYSQATRKAATRLGITDTRHWPKSVEIEPLLQTQLRLFCADRQPAELYRLRQLAVEIMQQMTQFQPRLLGAVLQGTANQHSCIELQLFADAPETVLFRLIDQQIQWQDGQRWLYTHQGRQQQYPLLRLVIDDTPVEFVILPLVALRQPLRRYADGSPEESASIAQVKALIIEQMDQAETDYC